MDIMVRMANWHHASNRKPSRSQVTGESTLLRGLSLDSILLAPDMQNGREVLRFLMFLDSFCMFFSAMQVIWT